MRFVLSRQFVRAMCYCYTAPLVCWGTGLRWIFVALEVKSMRQPNRGGALGRYSQVRCAYTKVAAEEAVELLLSSHHRRGIAKAKAHIAALTAEQRAEITQKATSGRWSHKATV